jgi:hypothetical protein
VEWIGFAVLAVIAMTVVVGGLLPTLALRLQLGTLLAADATTLAPVSNANKVALVNMAFTPNENMLIGALSFATFTGSTPLAGAAGAQGVGIDPATGDQIVTVLAPAGGWRWTCTAAPVSAETIYGYALTDHGGTTLLGTALLTPPISITEVGDLVDLGAVEITFVAQPMS